MAECSLLTRQVRRDAVAGAIAGLLHLVDQPAEFTAELHRLAAAAGTTARDLSQAIRAVVSGRSTGLPIRDILRLTPREAILDRLVIAWEILEWAGEG